VFSDDGLYNPVANQYDTLTVAIIRVFRQPCIHEGDVSTFCKSVVAEITGKWSEIPIVECGSRSLRPGDLPLMFTVVVFPNKKDPEITYRPVRSLHAICGAI
jgi:hypothetical protein